MKKKRRKRKKEGERAGEFLLRDSLPFLEKGRKEKEELANEVQKRRLPKISKKLTKRHRQHCEKHLCPIRLLAGLCGRHNFSHEERHHGQEERKLH